jgi:hypothetical protein
MIAVDTWKDLPKALRKMVKGLIAKEKFMLAMAYGHDDINNRTQGLWNWAGERIHGHDRTDQRKSGSPTRKTVAVMADKNTEYEDDLKYESQRKNMMDEGLTLMQTTRKGADKNTNEMNEYENWTKNDKPNRNDHMDETKIIILKKRRSNTEKPMTPGGWNRLPDASSHGFL